MIECYLASESLGRTPTGSITVPTSWKSKCRRARWYLPSRPRIAALPRVACGIVDDFGANSRKFKTATRLRLLEKPFVSVRMLTEMKTILLVEDDEQVREFACDVLELSGYRVLTAATPRAALALWNAAPRPLIF